MNVLVRLNVAILFVVASASAADKPTTKNTQAKPSAVAKEPPLKVGDKVELIATYGLVPVFATTQSYKDYLGHVKSGGDARIKDMPGLDLVPSFIEAEIVGFDASDTMKRPSLESLISIGLVPCVQVRTVREKKLCWVPAFYLRVPGSKGYGIEQKFPVFRFTLNRVVEPAAGTMMVVVGAGLDDAYGVADQAMLKDFIKARTALDQVGLNDLLKEKLIAKFPAFTRVLVLRSGTTDYNGESYYVIEVRFLEGPQKDKKGWFVPADLADASIELWSYRRAKAEMRPNAVAK